MKSNKKLFAILTLMMFMMTLVPMAAFGATTVTPAAATTFVAGTATNLAGNIVLTEAAAGEITKGNIVITAPSNVEFTATVPDVALTAGAGMTFGAVVVTSSTITIPVTAVSTTAATITIGGVVKPQVNSTVAGTHNLSITTPTLSATNCAPLTVNPAGQNPYSTVVSMDKTSLVADGTAKVKFTVYGYDQYNNVITEPAFVVTSNRGATDVFASSDATKYTLGAGADTAADGTPNTITYTITNIQAAGTGNGKVEFTVKSNVPGVAKIGIGLVNNGTGTSLADYLDGVSLATATTVGLVGVKEVTFTAAATNSIVVGADADGAGTGAGTSGNPWLDGTVNGNGIDTYTLTYKVVAANNAPIANQEVTFASSNSAVSLTKTSATTDGAGVVTVKASASKPGTFYVKATAGDKSLDQYMTFAANQPYELKLISDNNQVIAKDAAKTFKFQLLDNGGNQVDAAAAATGTALSGAIPSLNFSATKRPTGAAMDETIATSTGGGNGSGTEYNFTKSTEGYLELNIGAGELDTEGDYTIKAFFDNGKYATVDFTVKKQGTVTAISIAYDQKSVPLNTAVGRPTVKRIDAAGVSKTLTLAEVNADFTFTVSDVLRVTNAGANTFIVNSGAFTSTNDKNYAGDLTVTAVDKSKNLTASTTVSIAKQANGFTLTPPAAVTAVNTNAVVNAQFVDVDGKAISVSDAATINYDFYVISKPAGAIITTSQPATRLTDINKYGTAALKVASTVAGEVKVQVVATITGGSSAAVYSKDVTVNFGAEKVAIGAKAVTMFIGATGFVQDGTAKVSDVAPFIQDGRTFVAVRPIADAFGAEIGWNEATQTVTLTRTDMTLTIVIGSNTITKVAGGVTTTSTADVAAFIKDGRTVLPFRAVGEAFGATVSYDAATQAVSFAQ